MLTAEQKIDKMHLMLKMVTEGLSRSNHQVLFYDTRFLNIYESRGMFDKSKKSARGGLGKIGRDVDEAVRCDSFIQTYLKVSGDKLPLRKIDPVALYEAFKVYNTIYSSDEIDINTAVHLVNAVMVGRVSTAKCYDGCGKVYFTLSNSIRRNCPNCRKIQRVERKLRTQSQNDGEVQKIYANV
mgnify:CR=1 FL=1